MSSSSDGSSSASGAWGNLISRFQRALREPFRNPLHPLVFVVVIVAFGGLGVWVPAATYEENVIVSFRMTVAIGAATYALALLTSVFSDMFLGLVATLIRLRKNPDAIPDGFVYSTEVLFWAFTGAIALMTGTLGVLSLGGHNEDRSAFLAITSLLLTLFIWWIVNNDNERYKTETFAIDYPPQTTIGATMEGKGIEHGTIKFGN